MIVAVLDASALLAMLLRETGGDLVRAVLQDSAISVVNWSEVIGHFVRHGVAEQDIRLILDALPIERVILDDDLAYAAALMVTVTKPAGLSFGDRACLALASRMGVKAMTAARPWLRVAKSLGVEVELIR